MDDPDQTAPVPQDDGKVPPTRPTAREIAELTSGNGRVDPPAPLVKGDVDAGKKEAPEQSR